MSNSTPGTSSGTHGGDIITIRTSQGKLLRVVGDRVIADEDDGNYTHGHAQFLLDKLQVSISNSSSGVTVYRLRPKCKPLKYLAAAGSNVVVQNIPCASTTLCQSSFNFIGQDMNNGYCRLLLLGSSKKLYMGIHNNEVIIVPEASAGTFELQGVGVTANCQEVLFRVIGKSSNCTVEVDVEILESHNVKSHNSNVESHNSSRPSWLVRLWRILRPVHDKKTKRQSVFYTETPVIR